MDKKKLWLIVGAAVLALAVLIGLLCWLFWPGYRVVGDRLYVDIQQVGFIFDPETGEVLGETPVIINGTANSADGGDFDGTVEVLGYQNTANGVITGTAGTETTDDGWVLIHYVESCTHDEKVTFEDYSAEVDVTEKVTHLCDYYYDVCLYPEDGEFVAVEVGGYDTELLVYVICADSEEEAKELYAWYAKNR